MTPALARRRRLVLVVVTPFVGAALTLLELGARHA
jgi:hypothetical protein